jgi:response regulator RpfG family c-di-GMP phosphodiesterase
MTAGVAARVGRRTHEQVMMNRTTNAPSLPLPVGTPALRSHPAEGRGRILVVDDEHAVADVVRRYLERLGYEVRTAGTVADAMDEMARDAFDVVLVDLCIPGGSGIEVLAGARAWAPDARLVLMTGQADVPGAAAAVEHRIDALLLKPLDLADLGARMAEAVARARRKQARRRERETLEARLRQRDVESRIWVLRAAHSLVHAVEAKDPYTAGHAQRVTAYAMRIAEKAGGIDLLRFRLAGDLHDVGKIGVPDAVLNKPGRLDAAEMALVQKHPAVGHGILAPLVDDVMVLGVVQWHHERWDGKGYPDGIGGAEIPLPARILAVADTLDAMTSWRSYRFPLAWDTAVDEIRRCSGTQFDPDVVDLFLQVLPELQAKHASFAERAAA